MKKSYILRALLPVFGLMMTSCETSGQLLTGGVCTGVAVGAVAVGALASIIAHFQEKQLMA